ncbi:MAG: cell division protein ZapA [Clostridia bacterium]|nr:cell division protein ZapA [Clostridia bacterium]
MEKKVHSLVIAGEEYRIVSEESAEYMQSLAHELDMRIKSITKGSHISTTQAAVLAALQFADDASKNSGNADSLRAQLKAYLEDAAQAKSERDFYKREVERLKLQTSNGNNDTTGRLW